MPTRHDFIKAGTASAPTCIFFAAAVSCTARAQQPAGHKLPVTVRGKRVKTIDVHAHCNFHEAGALLREEGPRLQTGVNNEAQETFIDSVSGSPRWMRKPSTWRSCINTFWYNRERDLATQIVKLQNEKLAEFCAAHTDRFAAFASAVLRRTFRPCLHAREAHRSERKAVASVEVVRHHDLLAIITSRNGPVEVLVRSVPFAAIVIAQRLRPPRQAGTSQICGEATTTRCRSQSLRALT
jgi:hypothetical protein